jgi:hypothetical protein
MEFADWYAGVVESHAERYFELMKAYFEGYDDFGQVHFLVVRGWMCLMIVPLPSSISTPRA